MDDSDAVADRETLTAAVREAMYGVIGTIVMLGFALLLVAIGARGVFTTGNTTGVLLGVVTIVGGFVLAALVIRW